MSFVKTFEEFKNGNSNTEIVEAKQAVTQQNPEKGEIARWKVVLKAGKEEGTKISEENEVQSALDSLATYDPFINWWTRGTHERTGGPMGGTAQAQSSNSSSIGFADKGSHRQAGFLLKEKATVTFVFKQLVTDTNNKNETKVFYNIDSEPWATAKVSGSNTEVYVWNIQNEERMKLAEPKVVVNAKGESINIKDASAQSIKKLDLKLSTSSAPDEEAGAQGGGAGAQGGGAGAQGGGAGAQGGGAGAAGFNLTSAGNIPGVTDQPGAASAFSGIAMDPGKVNPKVKAVQQLIVDKGSDEAKGLLGSDPTDGRYGKSTAAALGLILNGNKDNPVNALSDALAGQLIAKLGVTDAELPKYSTIASGSGAPSGSQKQKVEAPKKKKEKAKPSSDPNPGF